MSRTPPLPVDLLERVAAAWPVSMADAAGNLLCPSDDSPFELAQRMVELTRGTLRYACALALAARAQDDRPPGEDPSTVADALEQLRKRGALTDGQWRSLWVALLRPYAARPDAHPLPGWVELVHGRSRGRTAQQLDALLAFRNTMAHEPPSSPAELRSLIEGAIGDLERWLEAIDPIVTSARLALPLQRPEEDSVHQRAYVLMGATMRGGRFRRSDLAPSVRVPPGRPILIDADSRPILALEPIVRVHRPSPEEPEEVFFLDGSGRRGAARYLALPSGAEREEAQVWESLGLLFGTRSTTAQAQAAVLPESPFRGLASFGAEHASIFFGRDREVAELANLVRLESFVTLTGPSGSGKTSLLRAGVGPALTRRHLQLDVAERGERSRSGEDGTTVPPRYAWVVVRPGSAPFAALGAALLSQIEGPTPLGEEDALEPDATVWASRLHAWARSQRRILVLAVDQAEELLTQGTDPTEVQSFASLLAELGAGPELPSRVVLSVRGDFFARMASLAPLYRRYDRHVMSVRTPGAAELVRTLTEPLRGYGVRFEEGLAEEMVEEVAESPSALPLLQFTAERLWASRGTRDVLERESYERLGRVRGALSLYADGVLEAMSEEQQRVAEKVLLASTTAEGARLVVDREELERRVADERLESVLGILTSARLLVARSDGGGEPRYELVHEGIVDHWLRLDTLRRTHAADTARRDALREAARAWSAHRRSRDLLWRGDALAAHRAWARSTSIGLTDEESEFVVASELAERRARRLRWGTVAVVGAALLTLTGWAGIGWKRADEERVHAAHEATRAREAERGATGQFLLAEAWRLRQEGRPYRAMALVRLAGGGDFGPSIGREALGAGLADPTALGAERARIVLATPRGENVGSVTSAAFSADGVRLATGHWNGTIRLWDGRRGTFERTLTERLGPVRNLSFSRDGRRLLALDSGGSAHVFGLSGPRSEIVLRESGRAISTAELSPDGTRVLTTFDDGTVRIFDAGTGAPFRQVRAAASVGGATAATYAPDGRRIAIVAREGILSLDADVDREPVVLGRTSSTCERARFDERGDRVIGLCGGAVLAWNADGPPSEPLLVEAARVVEFDLAPDGLVILRFGDGSVGIRSMDGRRPFERVEAGKEPFLRAAFVPGTAGRRFVAASRVGLVVFDSISRQALVELAFRQGWAAPVFALDPSARRIVVGPDNDNTTLWELEPFGEVSLSTASEDRVIGGAVSRDGRWVAISTETGTIRLLDPSTNRARVLDRTARTDALRFGDLGEDREAEPDAVLPGLRDVLDRLSVVDRVSRVDVLAFAPDGRRLLAATGDALVHVWDVATGREVATLRGHEGRVTSVSFSADGSQVLSASMDHSARLWDAASGRPIRAFAADRPLVFASFGREGRMVTVARDGRVQELDPTSGSVAWERTTCSPMTALGCSVERAGSSDDAATIWVQHVDGYDVSWVRPGGDPVNLQRDPGGTGAEVATVAISNDGEWIVIGRRDGKIELFEAASGHRVRELERHRMPTTSLRFSADGRFVLSSSEDGSARVNAVSDGRSVRVHRVPLGHAIVQAAFSGEERHMVTIESDGTARVWNAGVNTPADRALELAGLSNYRVCRRTYAVVPVAIGVDSDPYWAPSSACPFVEPER